MTEIEKAVYDYDDITILKIRDKELWLILPTELYNLFPKMTILSKDDMSIAGRCLYDLNDNFQGVDFYLKSKFKNNLKVLESSNYEYLCKVMIYNYKRDTVNLNDDDVNKVDLYILNKNMFKPEIEYVEKEVIKEVVVEKQQEKEPEKVDNSELSELINKYV